jgi:hypothetical protein
MIGVSGSSVVLGEFIVGEHLERKFKGLNIWVPIKDTGVDLLVTNSANSKAVSFQVKFSRDYLTTHIDAEFQDALRVCGWFTLNSDKITHSSAHFWVLVLIGSKKPSRDYVIITPADLLKQLQRIPIHRKEDGKFQVYIWVTEKDLCWDTRGLGKSELSEIAKGTFVNAEREFSSYLNIGKWCRICNASIAFKNARTSVGRIERFYARNLPLSISKPRRQPR